MGLDIQEIVQTVRGSVQGAIDGVFLPSDYAIAPDKVDYDPTSGVPIWHDPAEPLTAVPAMFADYELAERQEAAIPATDERAYIAALDVTTATPKLGDLIRKPDLTVWEVKTVVTDPVAALWELQIRPYPAGWPFTDWKA